MLTWQHIQQCQPCQHILDLVLSKMNGNKHSVTEYSLTFMHPYNLRRYFMFSWRRIFCHFVTFCHFSSYLKPSIIIFFLSFLCSFQTITTDTHLGCKLTEKSSLNEHLSWLERNIFQCERCLSTEFCHICIKLHDTWIFCA